VGIRVATLIKKLGKEKTIEILDTYEFPMMTTTHFEYAELLKKAKCLIEEGKLDELPELDKKLEELEDYDLWD
jgi:hypothetical protein